MFRRAGSVVTQTRAQRVAPIFAIVAAVLVLLCAAARGAPDQPKPGEPTDPKARKTFLGAVDWEKHGNLEAALDDYRKANKQDGGHCSECLIRAYNLAIKTGAYKDAMNVAQDWLSVAQTDADRAAGHFRLGFALQRQGTNEKKEQFFTQSCDEFKTALSLDPSLAEAHFGLGMSLSNLHQDDAARAEFKAFLAQAGTDSSLRERAARYVGRPDLARARMAPPFALTTIDGRHVSMDGLAGKVVLIDFWATWCGPCIGEIPYLKQAHEKFKDRSDFAMISLSLDKTVNEPREFLKKNDLPWLQGYLGEWSETKVAGQYGVEGIPALFLVSPDGKIIESELEGSSMIARLENYLK